MHVSTPSYVSPYVIAQVLFVLMAASAAFAADAGVSKLLKAVEKRYNSAKTLTVSFEETYKMQGRTRTEAGNLYLRKPGRMRWQYTRPAGKLFVSDGKNVYFYSSDTNRAEKMKLKETDDMRAPMAFLLGRLDFDKDFGKYQSRQDASGVFITATPRNDKMPYREVSFLVGADARIQRLVVTGQDSSVLDFTFANEQPNAAVADSLFQFIPPKGAEWVDSSAETAQGAR